MRILITIPHFFDPAGDGRYGSTRPQPQPRLTALTLCLRNLRTLYASPHETWYRVGDRLEPGPANQASRVEMDIIVCTCRDLHLLDQLAMPPNTYEHLPIDCEPMHLGFECHRVLHERLGAYDLYGYMEDDLILHDPAFFAKMCWFQEIVSEAAVLQPNRFERYISDKALKRVYIDFELASAAEIATRPNETVVVDAFGQSVVFRATTSAHSGCFFLSQSQMRYWATQDYFGNRDSSYIGPLESAATLGLIRTFEVYKPAPENASFFEIEHYGQAWSRRLAAVRFGAKPAQK